jgi:hypothetical protein
MKLKEPVLKIMNKQYEPSSTLEATFKRYTLSFKTDEAGRPILLFMGQKDQRGHVIGERYARRLKIAEDGTVIKDHWEHKGKAT